MNFKPSFEFSLFSDAFRRLVFIKELLVLIAVKLTEAFTVYDRCGNVEALGSRSRHKLKLLRFTGCWFIRQYNFKLDREFNSRDFEDLGWLQIVPSILARYRPFPTEDSEGSSNIHDTSIKYTLLVMRDVCVAVSATLFKVVLNIFVFNLEDPIDLSLDCVLVF